ncbi:MAG: HlyD family efflux transporter periplasmic adaptor subunit [Bacteroidales bacterium]|nr:HlyD family efflux transporter periplasmic adaptor subunit [Bacteroidales bacterium]
MKRIILLSFIAMSLLSCGKKKTETAPVKQSPVVQIAGIGKVVPDGGVSELASPVPGIVRELSVQPGSMVKKGTVLLLLDNTTQSLAINEINSRLASQKKSIESARALMEQERIALAEKERQLEDAKILLKDAATTDDHVRKLQNDYDQGLQKVKKLKNDFMLSEAQLQELSTEKAMKTEDLRLTTLKAPMDGTVLDILPKKGEAVSQYQTYARMAPATPLIVQAEIDEMYATRLALGQHCVIRLIGEVNPVAEGKIVRISPDLKKKSLFSDNKDDLEDRRIRKIEVSIQHPKTTLLIDTKVECKVQLGQ